MKTKLAFALALLALSCAAVELHSTRLAPDSFVVDRHMRNTHGTEALVPQYTSIQESHIATGGIADNFVSGTVTYLGNPKTVMIPFKDMPWYTPADRTMDQELLDTIAEHYSLSALKYAECCYGSNAVAQLTRSALARAERFFENPYTVATHFVYNPGNLPCRPPDARMLWLRDIRFPRYGANGPIRLTGRLMGSTNAIEKLSRPVYTLGPGKPFKMLPAHEEWCKARDTSGISYAMPGFGVAIHRPQDYAHELAHYFNWAVASESTIAVGSLSWAEFLPAFHGLKVHAYRNGYDLGTPGAFDEYFSGIVFSSALEAELSRDAYQLLSYYALAASLEGTANDTPELTRIREYCRSDVIGREVL